MSIPEYVDLYNHYMNGDYQYRQIKDTETAEKYIQDGRKVVFAPSYGVASVFLYTGVCLLIANVVISLILLLSTEFDATVQAIFWGILGGSGAAFLIIGVLLRSRKYFFVLGPEGIVYSLKRGEEPKLVRWQDVQELVVYDITYRIKNIPFPEKAIEITYKDGKKIELQTYSLNLREFPTAPKGISTKDLNELFAFVVRNY